MEVIFRCKRSGNTVSFSNEDDIKGMRQHEGYEEVITQHAEPKSFLKPQPEPLKRGRPKRNG